MNTAIDQITRQLMIINKLMDSHVPVTTDEMIKYLTIGCNVRGMDLPPSREAWVRQLQRDIRTISDNFYIDIKNIRGKGYYISDKGIDAPFSYERLFADLDLLSVIQPNSQLHQYILPEHNRNTGSGHLYPLLDAIKKSVKVEFDYTFVRYDDKINHYAVEPYFLKENQQKWYLIAFQNGQQKIFGLDRITNLSTTECCFKRDKSIDGKNLFNDSFGIWDDPEIPVEDIELKYDHVDGHFLKAVPLHKSQIILVDNKSEFRIRLRLRITNDFVMALLSRSRSLEVITPLHLRKRIAETCLACSLRNK